MREASGAWVSLHSADAALIHDRYEEPADLLKQIGATRDRPRYAGRTASAATATGLMPKHLVQLKAFLDEALG